MEMENSSTEKGEMVEEPLLDASETQKGGFRALLFILGILPFFLIELQSNRVKSWKRPLAEMQGHTALMNMGLLSLAPNLILYLMNEYHMDMVTGSNMLFIWSAVSNIAPVAAAIMADSFVGRFHMIGLGSVVSVVTKLEYTIAIPVIIIDILCVLKGMFSFWLTSVIPQARPPPCVNSIDICKSADMLQFLFVCLSFGIISIGEGAIRSSALAFGSDQLTGKVYQENVRAMERYFS
ncbi:putative chaperone protein dnaJ 10-like [Capsicum annuum]|nr:putative chaperone protein dnaJ 10-like [Capsicum annuum]